MNAISAAHPTLPMPSMVEVTNLDNGKTLRVRVNDRGPYVGGRLIDLSHAAAHELGYDKRGLAHVRVRYVGPAALGETATRAPLPPSQDLLKPMAETSETVATAARLAAAPIAVASATLPAALPSALPAAPSTALASSAPAMASSPAPAEPDAGPEVGPKAGIMSPQAYRIQAGAFAEPAPAEPDAGPEVGPKAGIMSPQAYRIQAGAFADSGKAARIAAQLGETAEATVEPVTVNGTTLYRVLVSGGNQDSEAAALREKVAALGYPNAWILKPN
ncbi:MAG: hypothetical protein CGW95_13355 [Phenylobacterium zucineum]|nr:MAG: hypothetical protein CGW95_13355 [Phenylobacterium zucineum]